ncbi:putative Pre-mRNA-splicing factor CWC21, partial [Geopyxis carbonaria]
MSSNVGLSTPRGSGTSGYVQRNMSFLRPRDDIAPPRDLDDLKRHRPRAPDQSILEHDRKRQVEVACLQLQDELEDAGELDEAAIEERVQALREELLEKRSRDAGEGPVGGVRALKPHQVHELAAAKLVETERLRNALGISRDYEEGSHWKRQDEDRERRREARERQ